jgi:cytochrome c oxidase cbb3-type subunit 4
MNPLKEAAVDAVSGTWVMAAMTVLFLALFLGLVVWAYAKRNRARFDEAAKLPLTTAEDDR